MKKNFKYMVAAMALLSLVACDKHDKIDDLVFVGPMAPTVFWNVPSTTVSAGSDVPFTAQYYTTGTSPVDHLEVWYDVTEMESKSVSAPWMSTSSYSVVSEASIKRRISQKISAYDHNEGWWNSDHRAYEFGASFPTSNTLGKVTWSGAEFDSTNVKTYFGENFMQNFKDSLWNNFIEPNPINAYTNLYSLAKIQRDSAWCADNFLAYVVDTFDENSQTTFKHFQGDVIPQPVRDMYQELGFKQLIESNLGELSISYTRQYILKAQLKCLDGDGTAGLSLFSEITLN